MQPHLPTITVTGTALDEVSPTAARIVVVLETSGEDVGTARVDVFELYQSLRQMVTGLGIPSAALSSSVRMTGCATGATSDAWREATSTAQQRVSITLPLVTGALEETAHALSQAEGVSSVELEILYQERDEFLRVLYDRMSEEAESAAQLLAASTGSRLKDLVELNLIDSGHDAFEPIRIPLEEAADISEFLYPVPVYVSALYTWSIFD